MGESSFLQNGISGMCGGKIAWWTWILSFLVFFFTALMTSSVAVGIGKASRNAVDRTANAYISFIILGGGWGVVFWGIPGPWWGKAILIAYVLIGANLSAKVAR